MLDSLRHFWRVICQTAEDQAKILNRIQDMECKLYALEQEQKRMLATIRKMAASTDKGSTGWS